MILGHLPVLIRLPLCLLLSVSLHGGLVFYDWTVDPVETQLTDAPVTVSLLPGRNVSTKVMNSLSQPVLPAPPQKAPRPVAAKQQLAPTSRSSKMSKQEVSQLPKQSAATKIVDRVQTEIKKDVSSNDVVCMIPQKVTADELPVLPKDGQAAVMSEADLTNTEAANQVKPAAAERIEVDSLVNASTFSQDLTQATPNYRSNPLPEYPYQARLKHWEGVVWLLVDVSADGQVEDLRVEKSCGHRLLDRTASRTVRRWQFTPAKRAGLPVLSQVRIPVRFDLEDD